MREASCETLPGYARGRTLRVVYGRKMRWGVMYADAAQRAVTDGGGMLGEVEVVVMRLKKIGGSCPGRRPPYE